MNITQLRVIPSFNHRSSVALEKFLASLRKMNIAGTVVWVQTLEWSSDEEWQNMGCPNDSTLRINGGVSI